MEKQDIDYGVIQERGSDYRMAVRIIGTTIGNIQCQYIGQSRYYSQQDWEVVFRDNDPTKYDGPQPDKLFRWVPGNL